MTSTVNLKGGPVEIGGNFPQKGQTAPDFTLADKTRTDVTLAHYSGKRKVLNIFPSIDTPTCATSVRTFNQQAAKLNNTVVLCISADLPLRKPLLCCRGYRKRRNFIYLPQHRCFCRKLWRCH